MNAWRYDQHQPGEPPCTEHDVRLTALEKRQETHSDRIAKTEQSLGDGRVEFANTRKDIQQLTSTIESAIKRMDAITSAGINWMDKIKESLILWGVPTGAYMLYWVVKSSGAIHP